MIQTTQQFLSAFHALPKQSQQEVLISLLRLSIDVPYDSPTDEQLRSAADAAFLELDRREAQA
jgi:hypothetical protein